MIYGSVCSGMEGADEPIAKNCSNWKNGYCEMCGVPWQYFEVSAGYRCEYFHPRSPSPALRDEGRNG